MKKIFIWFLSLLLILGGIFYFTIFFAYQPAEDLFNFPIPKSAEIIDEKGSSRSYNWSKASEENGIPFGYEMVLKANGWKKGERDGASVIYTKGKHSIDLISTTKHLNLIIEK